MANIGLPKISIIFRGLASSALVRGSKGTAVLIVKDDTDTSFNFVEYSNISDFTSTEQTKFTVENVEFIKDVLEGTPKKLLVARMDSTGIVTNTLSDIKARVEKNCWIGIVSDVTADHDDLVTFVENSNANDNKRYKTIVFNATSADNMHVVNFTNTNVVFADDRGSQTGDIAIPYLLGLLAGLSLDLSAIAVKLDKFTSVTEPADLETAVNAGEFVLYNDEGSVRVARGVNSLVTLDTNQTDDMKFILTVEVMDLIYTDIYNTWSNNYKGRYKNNADNQALLIGAINSYYDGLESDTILDINFDNVASVDIEAQRQSNVAIYGQEVVDGWTDEQVKERTVGTDVYLKSNIKILNTMEDLEFGITI